MTFRSGTWGDEAACGLGQIGIGQIAPARLRGQHPILAPRLRLVVDDRGVGGQIEVVSDDSVALLAAAPTLALNRWDGRMRVHWAPLLGSPLSCRPRSALQAPICGSLDLKRRPQWGIRLLSVPRPKHPSQQPDANYRHEPHDLKFVREGFHLDEPCGSPHR